MKEEHLCGYGLWIALYFQSMGFSIILIFDTMFNVAALGAGFTKLTMFVIFFPNVPNST